jgi:DNA-binding FadR family transcriptional regulator
MENKEAIFTSVKRKETHQLLEEQIRSAIFKSHYKPGEKIPTERELSIMFNASRSSVREALRSLQKSGLIIKKKGMYGGSFVNKSSSEPIVNGFMDMFQLGRVNLKEIRQARLVFEPSIAFEAAKKASQKDIKRLKRIHENHAAHLLSEGKEIVHDRSLHDAIAEMTGNQILIIIMKVLIKIHEIRTRHIRLDAKGKRSLLKQHLEIIEQIENHNPEMAYKKMEQHISLIQKDLSRLEKKAGVSWQP